MGEDNILHAPLDPYLVIVCEQLHMFYPSLTHREFMSLFKRKPTVNNNGCELHHTKGMCVVYESELSGN